MHGEIEAIRDACRKLATTDLSEADLYSSCEPCPLCASAMMIAGIGKLYYAATLEQSSWTIPGGKMPAIDTMRRELALPTSGRAMPSEQKLADESVSALEAWARKRM